MLILPQLVYANISDDESTKVDTFLYDSHIVSINYTKYAIITDSGVEFLPAELSVSEYYNMYLKGK